MDELMRLMAALCREVGIGNGSAQNVRILNFELNQRNFGGHG